MDIVFRFSPWLVFLCFFIAAGASYFLYKKDRLLLEIAETLKWFLITLRFLALFVLLLFLLEPFAKHLETEIRKPILLIGVDNSQSMALTVDSIQLKSQLEALNNELSSKYQIEQFQFGERVEVLNNIDFSEKLTDISSFFQEIKKRFTNQNIGATLLISDGLANRGRAVNANLNSLNNPVFAMSLGDTATYKDIGIASVRLNKFAYLGNDFVVDMQLFSKKYDSANTKLLVRSKGKILTDVPVSFESKNDILNFTLQFPADSIGVHKYEINLNALADEKTLENNKAVFYIEVLESRSKILLLSDAPHPDVAAIKSVLDKNKNYTVKSSLFSELSEDVAAFNLVVLHKLPNKESKSAKLISDLERKKVPFLLFFVPGTDETLINQAAFKLHLKLMGGKDNAVFGSYNNGFSLFSLSKNTEGFFRDLPPLAMPFMEIKSFDASKVLVNQRIGDVQTSDPLLLFVDDAETKAGFWFGEGIWRWRMRNYLKEGNQDAFDELFSKTVQYLVLKTEKKRFVVKSLKQSFAENEDVVFESELYDASFEPALNQNIEMIIYDEDGNQFAYSFSQLGNSYRLNAGSLNSGTYAYEAKAQIGEELFIQKGSFVVTELQVEMLNIQADHSGLYELSMQSGGEMFYDNQWSNLVDALKNLELAKGQSISRKIMESLINWTWIFYLIIAMLGFEWFIRKRSGAY